MAAAGPIPLSVIGGFLGAGKTTLLNRLLQGASGIRFAVIVNDFGDLAIDGDLVADHGGDTITFANGCLCCTMGDSLLSTLNDLARRDDPPDHIVVEASGVADPRQIADVAVLHPGLVRDLVLVLVDADTICERARDSRLKETVIHQAEAADMIVLNKCDLASEQHIADARAWAAEQAPRAALLETAHARIAIERLLTLDSGHGIGNGPLRAPAVAHIGHAHDHANQFSSAVVILEAPLDLAALRGVLNDLPPSILRAKGFVSSREDPSRLHLVQLSGRRLRIEPWPVAARAGVVPPRRGLVFVGTPDMPPAAWLTRRLGA